MFSKFKVSGPNEKRGGVWLMDDLTTYKDRPKSIQFVPRPGTGSQHPMPTFSSILSLQEKNLPQSESLVFFPLTMGFS